MSSLIPMDSETAPNGMANKIFAQQPSFKTFCQQWTDNDTLSLIMNEIELSDEEIPPQTAIPVTRLLRDPRTLVRPYRPNLNHNTTYAKYKLPCPEPSKMSREEQQHGVRLLTAWQERREVLEEDLSVWLKISDQRIKENKAMQDYINEWADIHFNKWYTSAHIFVNLYRKRYEKSAQVLRGRNKNDLFNTYTALPKLESGRKSKPEIDVKITDIELKHRRGFVPLLNECESFNYTNLRAKLENFTDHYNQLICEEAYLLHKEIKNLMEQQPTDDESLRLFIPLESIIFLLSVGDYCDLFTEMLINIQTGVESSRLIYFQKPIPSNNCGWHTNKLIAEQANAAYISIASRKWLEIDDNAVILKCAASTPETITLNTMNKEEFKVMEFEEYLKKTSHNKQPEHTKMMRNEALISWTLKENNCHNSALNILTTMALPPAIDEKCERFVGAYGIKIEYKPQFGCEEFTKTELLNLWFQMRFMDSIAEIEDAVCMRLTVAEFKPHLKQRLNISDVERTLLKYNTNISALLSNLFDFLQIIFKMPNGEYLIRYNPLYTNQILICTPAIEKTKNTISVNNLLNNKISDWSFIMQRPTLPISDSLCSYAHQASGVMPCTFNPPIPEQLALESQNTKKKKKAKFVCERDKISQRLALEQQKFLKRQKERLHKKKRIKNLMRKKRKREQQLEHDKDLGIDEF